MYASTAFGYNSGWITSDGRSITEIEFDHARAQEIPCLAYMRDGTTPVLPEFVDKGDDQLKVLKRFKGKVDSSLKRDTFSSAEQLRGHVMRDILWWALNQPEVKKRLTEAKEPSVLPEVKKYLDVIHGGDTDKAIEVITSHSFALDMERFGTAAIHREALYGLLELGSLSPPTKVLDSKQRSRLLLDLLSDFPDSAYAPLALKEARVLEEEFCSEHYSFHVARAEAKLHPRCDRALPALKRMLKHAWRTKNVHTVAEALRSVANYYSNLAQHARARHWYWLTIKKLLVSA